ncbi:MAG: hypothetical protein OXC63_14885 [Aestuariivita sp.]|nr:hypothetical protein [Aestuariivita sp.]MCY4348212.1 hypothetical protein [Aestuariivita sp.]
MLSGGAVRLALGKRFAVRNRLAERKPQAKAASKALAEQEQALKAQLAAVLPQNAKIIPNRLPLGELNEEDKINALATNEKFFLNIIRMIGYRTETQMMPIIASASEGNDLSRHLFKALFSADADAEIISEPDNGVLRVRILAIENNRNDVKVATLFAELKKTKTIYQGTTLRVVYELPNNSYNLGEPASLPISQKKIRCQEV